jgi:hypothetical protein
MSHFTLCAGRLEVRVAGTASRTLFEAYNGIAARFFVDTADACLLLQGVPLRLSALEGQLAISRMDGDVLFEFRHRDGHEVWNTCEKSVLRHALTEIAATTEE